MSRLLEDTGTDTGDYLFVTTAPVTTYPCTISCWFRSDNSGKNQTLAGLFDNTVSHGWFAILRIDGAAGDDVDAGARESGGSSFASSTTNYSTDTWHHACGTWVDDNSRSAFIDGGSKGTNTVGRTPNTPNQFWVGRAGDSSPADTMSGRICEVGLWNIVLSDDEIAGLGKGARVLGTRPQSLKGYWPILGVGSPEPDYIGSNNLTLDGAGLGVADHSPTGPAYGFDFGWQGAFGGVAATSLVIPRRLNTLLRM